MEQTLHDMHAKFQIAEFQDLKDSGMHVVTCKRVFYFNSLLSHYKYIYLN